MVSTIQRCGELLLDVYDSAIKSDVSHFQDEVLRSLNAVIGFDRAWWGMMSPTSTGFELLSSHRADLPESFEQKWQSITHDDSLAISANSQPARTVRFDTRALHTTRGLYELNAEHNIRNAICTSIRLDSASEAFFFISLFRCGKSAAFNNDEVGAKQFLMPHVYSGWRHNLNQRFRSTGPDPKEGSVCAFLDLQLTIVEAHPRWTKCMESEWPQWTGPRLPEALHSALRRAAPATTVQIGSLRFSLQHAGGLFLLSISRVVAIECLTQREREVAIEFTQGSSYKETARRLQMAPSTVRHHLRVIYTKIGVSNKAQLIHIMALSAECSDHAHAKGVVYMNSLSNRPQSHPTISKRL